MQFFYGCGIINIAKNTNKETKEILTILKNIDKKEINPQKSTELLSKLKEETNRQVLKSNELLSIVENQNKYVDKSLSYNKNIYHNISKMKKSFYSMSDANNNILKNSAVMNSKLSESYELNKKLLEKLDKLIILNK